MKKQNDPSADKDREIYIRGKVRRAMSIATKSGRHGTYKTRPITLPKLTFKGESP